MSASRVPLSSMANGTVLQKVSGAFAPAPGASASVYLHDPASTLWGGVNAPVRATVFSTELGVGTLTQPLSADSNGALPGWVNQGQDLDIVASFAGQTAAPALAEPDIASQVGNASSAIYYATNAGVVADGATDSTAALNTAFTQAAALATISGTGVAILQLPAGQIVTKGGHSDGGARILVRGMGEEITQVFVSGAATPGTDVFTLTGRNSGIGALRIEGNRYNVTSGDGVVLNGGYQKFWDIGVYDTGANGISVGKASVANSAWGFGFKIQNCAGYGMRIFSTAATADCRFMNGGVGVSGHSGVRIDQGSQVFTSVHSWGNGVEVGVGSLTDAAGFDVNASACHFIGCEGETNNGQGIRLNGQFNTLTGGKYWGNCAAGVYDLGQHNSVGGGGQIYRNGISNGAQTSINYDGIALLGQYAAISGNSIWDDAGTIPAGNYTNAPTFPFPGRAAVFSQNHAVGEGGGSSPDYNTVGANTMRAEDTRLGIAFVQVGTHSTFSSSNTLGSAQFTAALSPDQLKTGEWTFSRDAASSNSFLPTSGDIMLSFFTAQRTELCTQIGVLTGTTPVAGGLTLVRFGLYTVDSSDNLTLVASTVNDTTLLVAAGTMYFKALQANYTKIAGQRYAIAVIQVGTTPAKLGGAFSTRGSSIPHLLGRQTGQTDLTNSIAVGSIANPGYRFYAEITP